jgi:hypothetical protein
MVGLRIKFFGQSQLATHLGQVWTSLDKFEQIWTSEGTPPSGGVRNTKTLNDESFSSLTRVQHVPNYNSATKLAPPLYNDSPGT